MKRLSTAGACLFFLPAMLMLFVAPPASAGTMFSGKSIPMGSHKSDEQVFVGSVRISEDKQHITYVSRNHDGKVRVWIDGVTGVAYDGTSTPQFAPRSSRVGYIAADGGKMFTIIDGKKGTEYANADSLAFSPDGARFAFRAQDEKGHIFTVVDGVPGPLFVNVLPDPGIVFSPDSRHVVYIGVNEAKSQVVVKDQTPLRAFDQVKQVLFSPDSRHLAYAARSGPDWSVIHDDKPGRAYNNVAGLFFSPDSRQLAYMAEKSRRIIFVKDEKELFTGESAGMIFFSPDSTRFGFMIKKGNGWHMVVDGKKGPLIGRPDKATFSHDSRHFTYSALIGTQWAVIKDTEIIEQGLKKVRFLEFIPDSSALIYIAVPEQGKEYMMVDGKKSKSYDSIGMPVFRPGKEGEIAHVVQDEDRMFFVMGETEEGPYKAIGIPMDGEGGSSYITTQYPFFSSDGAHVAYPAIDDKDHCFMVMDGKRHENYQAVTEPVFSPDGKHMAYMAKKEEKWLTVVDGIEGKERFDGVLKGGGIVFDSDTSFYVLMLNLPGPSFYKLAVTIGGDKK